MSAFDDVVNAAVGEAGDIADIRLSIARLYAYGFDSTTLRFWRGQGRLFTSDGSSWLGTIDASGRDHHTVPSLADGRDGTAADLTFALPYLDKATFDAVKAMHEPVSGRLITCSLAAVQPGEGMRPQTPISFFGEYTMQSATFSDALVRSDSGALVRSYGISVLAKSGNAGRSRAPRGTYTDTCQQQRAALLGVTPDYGCGFVAQIANETLQFP